MSTDVTSLTHESIQGRFWRLHRVGGHVLSEVFSFLDGGIMGGYFNSLTSSARYWSITNGQLSLLNHKKVPTIKFDDVQVANGLLVMSGRHLLNPSIVFSLQEQKERATNSSTQKAFAKEIERFSWSIGDHTYGVPSVLEKGAAGLKIGKYCSIAMGVKIALGNHRTDTLTTYPFKALTRFWQHVPAECEDHTSRGDVIIGNDVWIGSDVFIGSGVKIGTGAIVGAKSLVVRDVNPYAIVGGNPLRVLRHRFAPDEIQQLLESAWWDLSDENVDLLIPHLMSKDVTEFLACVRRMNDIKTRLETGLPPGPSV